MSTQDHIVRGFKATLVSRAIYMVSSALLMFLLARLLNPDGYGALYWAIGILAVVQLFADLGLGKSSARYISEYSERDTGQIPYLLRSTLAFKLIALAVVSYVLLLFHELFFLVTREPRRFSPPASSLLSPTRLTSSARLPFRVLIASSTARRFRRSVARPVSSLPSRSSCLGSVHSEPCSATSSAMPSPPPSASRYSTPDFIAPTNPPPSTKTASPGGWPSTAYRLRQLGVRT